VHFTQLHHHTQPHITPSFQIQIGELTNMISGTGTALIQNTKLTATLHFAITISESGQMADSEFQQDACNFLSGSGILFQITVNRDPDCRNS